MNLSIHSSWHTPLATEFEKPYWWDLIDFIRCEYSQKVCYPIETDIFRAYDVTPWDQVRVVILGQDPYHTPWAAMGLSFSIPEWAKIQPSLRNILKELESDTGVRRVKTDLTDWAEQGVLLLNTVLTVRQAEPASHQKHGWEKFTDATIRALSLQKKGIVFILWWAYAIAKESLIDTDKHYIITSPHPSPLSASRGFFGSKPFSKTNNYLTSIGKSSILW